MSNNGIIIVSRGNVSALRHKRQQSYLTLQAYLNYIERLVMENPYLYDIESKQPTQWKGPRSSDLAVILRKEKEERNIHYHKCGEFGCSFCDPTNSLDEV